MIAGLNELVSLNDTAINLTNGFYLNGIPVLGHDLKISATVTFSGDDISGQSSFNDLAETGDKATLIRVKLNISYKQAQNLVLIMRLAQSKTSAGERRTYQILSRTTLAMNIRKVKFFSDLRVREDDRFEEWHVSFVLTEIESVPEAIEAIQVAKTVVDQPVAGTLVEPAETAAPVAVELTGFERILDFIDKSIGDP
jgi:hypothetical protein